MGILEKYRIKKSIDTLLSVQNLTGPEAASAIARLQQIGRPAIPKLLDALGTARNREPIVALLATLVENDTLPLFITALTNAPARVAAGVVDVLSRSDTYDPNRLLGLFTNLKLARADLEKLLVAHKRRLHPDALLRLLTTTSQDDRAIIFRLVDQVATEASLPDLIHRIRTEDWTIRLHLARTLSRFRTSAVRDTLVKLLADPQRNVRLMALSGLAAQQMPVEAAPLCQLLHDPDPMIRQKATGLLLEFLQAEADEVRQGAVEGLNAVGNVNALRTLIERLKDKDWWVTVRVAEALGTHGGPRIVEAVLALLRDQEAFIRQGAFEIFHAMKDKRTFRALVEALKDKEVRESAIAALAALGDKRAVSLFLNMLEGDTTARLIAIRALVVLGEPQTVHPLLVQLQNPDPAVQREVLQALAVLTNAAYAPDVLQAVMAVRDNAAESVKELANRMATAIIKRFGQKVMPQSALVEAAVSAHLVVATEAATPPPTTASVLDDTAQGHSGSFILAGKQGTGTLIDVAALEPGVVLAERYRVIRRVGQGSFSTVFLVDDIMVHEDVILKILNPQVALDDNMIKRFIHELRYARKVTHENVIRIHDFIGLGRSYAISMEYFPSHSLADDLQAGVPLALKRGLKIIWDICRGVGAAHQADVVHRDLKPPNILVNDAGMVKIVDFGVAAVTSDMGTRLTRIGTLLGTPTYMAPEQVRCRAIDARTDIYSLGVIMYEVFTGRPPYIGEDMAVLFQHVEGKPTLPRQLNPDLAPALEAIILKAMAVEPEQRFQSIDALRKSLMEFSRQQQ